MKKINSIGYGHRLVLGVVALGLGFPLVLTLLDGLVHAAWLRVAAQVSCVLGLLLLAFLLVLLAIELGQDRRINRYYLRHRNRKLPLGDGRYECQACGNPKLHAGDKQCGICGQRFEEDTNEPSV